MLSGSIFVTLQVGPNILNETWLSYVLPEEKSSSNYLADFKDFDGCKMFKEVDQLNPNPINEEVCTKSDFNPNETQKCTEYIYDNEYFDETFVTRFDLVCDKEYQKSLLRTFLILGLLFGSLIGGRMGDQLGRKKAMFIAIALICPSCLIGGYVDNYHSKFQIFFLRSHTLKIDTYFSVCLPAFILHGMRAHCLGQHDCLHDGNIYSQLEIFVSSGFRSRSPQHYNLRRYFVLWPNLD